MALSCSDSTTTAAEPMKAAVFLQGVEIERDIAERGRQDAAGGAAREITVETMPVEHAAAVFIDQFTNRDARRRQVHPAC